METKPFTLTVQIAIIIIAVLLFGFAVYFTTSQFFSLENQTQQNTQTIQQIVSFLNTRSTAPVTPTPAPTK